MLGHYGAVSLWKDMEQIMLSAITWHIQNNQGFLTFPVSKDLGKAGAT